MPPAPRRRKSVGDIGRSLVGARLLLRSTLGDPSGKIGYLTNLGFNFVVILQPNISQIFGTETNESNGNDNRQKEKEDRD